jgi:hypothetical protein
MLPCYYAKNTQKDQKLIIIFYLEILHISYIIYEGSFFLMILINQSINSTTEPFNFIYNASL